MSRAVQTLDKLPGHCSDVSVNLGPLFGLTSSDSNVMLPGSVASVGVRPETEASELEAMVFRPERECMSVLFQHLAENSPKKKVDSPAKKFVNASSLESVLREYSGDYESILSNLSSVSRASCVLQCVQREKRDVRRKKLQSLMSQVSRTLCEGGRRVLGDLTDLVRSRHNSHLTLDDVLTLLVFVYSSADVRDEFPRDDEERLRSVLGDALLQDGSTAGPVLQSLCSSLGGDDLDEVVALNVINSVWERLEGIKESRREVGQYESLINYEGEFSSLLSQLLGDVYHDDRREVSCLHHHSDEGLAGMLRSGLGWLGSAPVKPHPRENPWIIVFVVGGVTPREAAECQELVKGVGKLTLGGTRLLSPTDTLHMTFINDALMMMK